MCESCKTNSFDGGPLSGPPVTAASVSTWGGSLQFPYYTPSVGEPYNPNLYPSYPSITYTSGYMQVLPTINVKYLTDIEKIQKIEKGDWIDLRAAEDITMRAFEHKLIPLGVVIKLPAGYEAHIVPRSSTYKNFGIIQANHMGVVDESYCGPTDQWFMSAIALRDTSIKKNDRICQFRIMEKMNKSISIIEVDEMTDPDRGGHGSTGKS